MTPREISDLMRSRSRRSAPRVPNPLVDPIAHIKRPLKALNEDRRGQGMVRRGQSVVEFSREDIRMIRANFMATQKQFARLIGVKYETIRNWERGRRRPHGPARALLRAIDADPVALARALNWQRRDFRELPVDLLDE